MVGERGVRTKPGKRQRERSEECEGGERERETKKERTKQTNGSEESEEKNEWFAASEATEGVRDGREVVTPATVEGLEPHIHERSERPAVRRQPIRALEGEQERHDQALPQRPRQLHGQTPERRQVQTAHRLIHASHAHPCSAPPTHSLILSLTLIPTPTLLC